jgi:nucleoid-associated protein YgaU
MGLFGKSAAQKEQENREKARLLTTMITDRGFKVEGLRIDYFDSTAAIFGMAQSEEDKKRIVLALKGAEDVKQVNDSLRVAPKPAAPLQPTGPAIGVTPTAPKPGVTPEAEVAEPAGTSHTVKAGETLSKIAKAHYGDASKYMVIFEANQPMLKDPNKIFPGQVLRIPPLD